MPEGLSETGLEFKRLLFEMHEAGYTQDAIAQYLNKSKKTINDMLKPLQNGKGKKTNG
jgi:predicted transcriptional regulator